MFMEERQREITKYLSENGNVTVSELTEKYGISDESARRDLRMLEQKGICKRTHGGAIIMPQVNVRPPLDRRFEDMPIYPTYRAIAQKAAAMIRENDVVYLTGGSFGYIMLTYMPKEIHYTVVVNTVDLAKELRFFENTDVYVAGGKMRKSGSVVDSMATEFIGRLHFDLCFLTGAGLTAAFGLSNGTDETAAFQRMVLKNSRKRILLMPGKKIGIDSFIKVCEADSFDTIITDWECPEDQIAALVEKDLAVTVVEESI